MTTKILTFFLSIVICVKIILWLLKDVPMNRSSVLVIIILIVILNIKNRFVWIFGLVFIIAAISSDFLNLNLGASDAWQINPFYFLDSIRNFLKLKTNNPWYYFIGIFPFFFYIFLLTAFITRKFRRKYFEEKTVANSRLRQCRGLGFIRMRKWLSFFFLFTFYLSKFSVYLFSSVSKKRHWRKRRNVSGNRRKKSRKWNLNIIKSDV